MRPYRKLPQNSSQISFTDKENYKLIYPLITEIDNACVFIGELIAVKLLPQLSKYEELVDSYYTKRQKTKHLLHAGLGSESLLSAKEWQEFVENDIANLPDKEEHYKFFYYFEINLLLSSVQETLIGTYKAFEEIYNILNRESICDGLNTKEGLTTVVSTESSMAWIMVEAVTIKLCSCFDYLAKLAYELENLPQDYSKLPEKKSKKILHIDVLKTTKYKTKLKTWSDEEFLNSIFDGQNQTVKTLKTLRNHIIHQGSLSIDTVIYQDKNQDRINDRFMLIPDMKDGAFENYNGRILFYSKENKINLILPKIFKETCDLILNTLKIISIKYFPINVDGLTITDIKIPNLRPETIDF